MFPSKNSQVVVSETSHDTSSEPDAVVEAHVASRSSEVALGETYHAFISYRHVKPDREWAVWLHTAIERYRVPRRLIEERNLPSRVRPLYRDEEETAASADLSMTIKQALEKSRYLIVICSPATPGGKWLNEEISYFQSLGLGDRILSLLIEGEPHESFPPQLRDARSRGVDIDGQVVDAAGVVEPLAADVRLRRGESRRKQRRMAKLRILAALLGCGFDELRQRDRERRRRTLIILAPVLATVICGLVWLALTAIRFSRESESRGEEIERLLDESRSREAAARSLSLLTDNPVLSLLLAKRAFEIAPTEQAGSALRQAVVTHAVVNTQAEHTSVPFDSLEIGVKGLSASREARRIVTFGEGNTAHVWDPQIPYEKSAAGGEWQPGSGRLVGVLRGHTGRILSVSITPLGDQILTASEDGTARLWKPTSDYISQDLISGETIYAWRPTHELVHDGPVRDASLSQDGTRVLTVGDDGLVKVWEANSGKLVKNISPTLGSKSSRLVFLTSAAFSRDGAHLVFTYYYYLHGRQGSKDTSGPPEGAVEVWDTTAWARVKNLSYPGSIYNAQFSPDGRFVVFMAMNYRPPMEATVWHVYDLDYYGGPFSQLNKNGRAEQDGKKSVKSAIFNRGGEYILTAGDDGAARLWDKGWNNVLTLRGHGDRINVAAYSPDGKYILTGGDDGMVIVWTADALQLFARPIELYRVASDRAPRTLTPEEEKTHLSPKPTGQ